MDGNSNLASELFHFDLHGSLIFDNYEPISCPPSKGLRAPLSVLTSTNSFFSLQRREAWQGALILDALVGSGSLQLPTGGVASSVKQDGRLEKNDAVTSDQGEDNGSCAQSVENCQDAQTVFPVYVVPLKLCGNVLSYLNANESAESTVVPPREPSSIRWNSAVGKLARMLNQRRRQRADRLSQQYSQERLPDSQNSSDVTLDGGPTFGTTKSRTSWELMPSTSDASTPSGWAGAVKRQGSEVYSALKGLTRRLGAQRAAHKEFSVPSNSLTAEGCSPDVSSPVHLPDERDEMASCDPQELAEVDHFSEFLQKMDPSCGADTGQARHPTRPQDVSRFFDAVLWLLQEFEREPCSAVVLLFSVGLSDETQWQGKIDRLTGTTVGLSGQLPAAFRQLLTIPVISWTVLEADCAELLRMALSSGITDAVIPPIPIRPGDHVYREIREKGTLKFVTHHGIYMGNGRVIHFAGNEFSVRGLLFGSSAAKIRITSIIRFMTRGSRLCIQQYRTCDPTDVVLTRAERALVDQTYPDYDMFKNNCEHFCHYCKTGVSRSKQVECGVKYAAAASAVVATAVAIGVSAAMVKRSGR